MNSHYRWAAIPIILCLFGPFAHAQENDDADLGPWTSAVYVSNVFVEHGSSILQFRANLGDYYNVDLAASSPDEQDEIKRLTDSVFRAFIKSVKVQVRIDSNDFVRDIREEPTD